jgi:hypothetical protein
MRMTMQTRELRHYKGYVIEADPQKQGKSGPWATYLVIRRDRPGGPRVKPFEDDATFPNRIEAVRHCFELGARIIDGEIEGWSVDEL